MTAREAAIAEFRTKAELTEFIAEWIEDFLIRAENDEPPFDAKTALIELSAEAMTQAILEDGNEVHGIVETITARMLERMNEIIAAQDAPQ